MGRYESQIGDQLHQGGLTPGQSDSIARWLRRTAGGIAQEVRELGPGSLAAKSANFLNKFIAPEQRRFRTPAEQAAADGVGANGKDGKATEVDGGLPPTLGGTDPSQGPSNIFNDNSLGFDPVDLRPIFARLARLEEQLFSLDRAVTANTSKIKGLQSTLDALRREVAGATQKADQAIRIARDVKLEIDAAVECP